jgi:hypothetical protein
MMVARKIAALSSSAKTPWLSRRTDNRGMMVARKIAALSSSAKTP